MCDQWMPRLTLEIDPDEFRRLPRNGSYSYALHQGALWINPRPRFLHGRLKLAALPESGPSSDLRLLRESDWAALPRLFAATFEGVEPFRALPDPARLEAARACLTQTRLGGDGPLLPQASFVMPGSNETPLGVVLITLLPPWEEGQLPLWQWEETPPPDAVERREGRPHLTWVMVERERRRRGLATTLLHAACAQLRALGFATLDSTFLLGNDLSLIWHWRSGFELLPELGRR
jgi:GNAT superfamily N-acetyltransferase